MKWSYTQPERGDMIRVSMGTLYHFGIYVSDDEVIQFGLPPTRRGAISDAEVEVLSSDIDSFLSGGFLEVCQFDKKEKKKNRSVEEIVAYARSKIGMRGYHILYNNCEHFANECVTGEQICRQAEDVRALFRTMPIVDVYIAALPEDAPIGEVDCEERQAEIAAVTNERVKREKYFVWKLLQYAMERSFGPRARKLNLRKESYGGWSAGEVYVSLSHSEGALAVAVSRAAVGIDIEHIHSPRAGTVAERVMNAQELMHYLSVPEKERAKCFIEIWTAKEALFKSKGCALFSPKEEDTVSASLYRQTCAVGEREYVWTVATATPERVRTFFGIDLSKMK